MISGETFLKWSVALTGFFALRVVARYRVDRRKQAALKTPLVDPILLETTFAPQAGDDANLLAEVRDTLKHLNRQTYAEEFWGIDQQIARLDAELPKTARATLRRALLRMLRTEDRWLQVVGAKTSGRLKSVESADCIRELIATVGSERLSPWDMRFRDELTGSLAQLDAS